MPLRVKSPLVVSEEEEEPSSPVFRVLIRWSLPVILLVYLLAFALDVFELRPEVDADRWQHWADGNQRFFAALEPGASIAILPDINSRLGLVFTRTDSGVDVERHVWLPVDQIPVEIVVEPAATRRWLDLDVSSGSRFWEEWRSLSETGGVRLYLPQGTDVAEQLGYGAFLEELGIVPEDIAPEG